MLAAPCARAALSSTRIEALAYRQTVQSKQRRTRSLTLCQSVYSINNAPRLPCSTLRNRRLAEAVVAASMVSLVFCERSDKYVMNPRSRRHGGPFTLTFSNKLLRLIRNKCTFSSIERAFVANNISTAEEPGVRHVQERTQRKPSGRTYHRLQ